MDSSVMNKQPCTRKTLNRTWPMHDVARNYFLVFMLYATGWIKTIIIVISQVCTPTSIFLDKHCPPESCLGIVGSRSVSGTVCWRVGVDSGHWAWRGSTVCRGPSPAPGWCPQTPSPPACCHPATQSASWWLPPGNIRWWDPYIHGLGSHYDCFPRPQKVNWIFMRDFSIHGA